MKTRREHDLLGEADVPAEAYWGIHTLRALENFPITGKAIGSYADLVRAPASAQPREHVAEHQRRLSDGAARRHLLRHPGTAGGRPSCAWPSPPRRRSSPAY
jgi:hypothetical protein